MLRCVTSTNVCSTYECDDTSDTESSLPGRRVGDDVQLSTPFQFLPFLSRQPLGSVFQLPDFLAQISVVRDVQRRIHERGEARLRRGHRSLRGGDNLGARRVSRLDDGGVVNDGAVGGGLGGVGGLVEAMGEAEVLSCAEVT